MVIRRSPSSHLQRSWQVPCLDMWLWNGRKEACSLVRSRGFWELGILDSGPNSAGPCAQTYPSLGFSFPICTLDHL